MPHRTMAQPHNEIIAKRLVHSFAIATLTIAGLCAIFAVVIGVGVYSAIADILRGETTRTVCNAFASCDTVALNAIAWRGGLLFLGLVTTACLLVALGLRERIVRYEADTKTVSLVWGRCLPIVYRSFDSTDWIAFSVRKVIFYTVHVMSSGYQPRSPKIRYVLQGMTQDFRAVNLGDFAGLNDAQTWRHVLAKTSGIAVDTIALTVKLPIGGVTNMQWETDPFFSTHKDAQCLYRAMGDAGKWECYGAKSGPHYDQPDPYTLEKTNFDIPLLASIAEVKKPWRTLAQLIDGGWVVDMTKDTVARCVDLENRLPWVNADVVLHAKQSQLATKIS